MRWRTYEKVCKYIDLPLQHASDAVLKRMKRPGTRAGYERLLDRIRTPRSWRRASHDVHRRLSRARPTQDFAELQSFVDAMQFDHVGVFTYSHEEGHVGAQRCADDVPAAVKRRRQSSPDAGAEETRSAGARRRASDVRSACWSTVHRMSMNWSCARGSEGQAPDIDPLVYLTDCDPASIAPGPSSTRRSSGAKATICWLGRCP